MRPLPSCWLKSKGMTSCHSTRTSHCIQQPACHLAGPAAIGYFSQFGMKWWVGSNWCCEPLPRSWAIGLSSWLWPSSTTLVNAEPIPDGTRSMCSQRCLVGPGHYCVLLLCGTRNHAAHCQRVSADSFQWLIRGFTPGWTRCCSVAGHAMQTLRSRRTSC